MKASKKPYISLRSSRFVDLEYASGERERGNVRDLNSQLRGASGSQVELSFSFHPRRNLAEFVREERREICSVCTMPDRSTYQLPPTTVPLP